jgi:transcriptional regulator with XRE-family HTH domain
MPRSRSPVVDRRRLAAALRDLRERSRLTLEEAASQAIDASGAKLSRIENGKQVASPRDVRDLCLLYGVPGERLEELVAMAESAREPGWRESYEINDDDYIDLESDATKLDEFEIGYVPGLLQTPDYARAFQEALINLGRVEPWRREEIEEWLEIRRVRQRIVASDSGVRLTFVLDESLLMRSVGGRSVMRQQWGHLLAVAEQPNVEVYLLPFDVGASPAPLGGFTLLTMSDDEETGYVESQAGNHFVAGRNDVARLRRIHRALVQACPQTAFTKRVMSLRGEMH